MSEHNVHPESLDARVLDNLYSFIKTRNHLCEATGMQTWCRVELEERSLAARAGEGGGGGGAGGGDAAQAAREAIARGPRLHQQCVGRAARLHKRRDARVAGGDYDAAAALDRKGDAYEALGKQLAGLAVMRWHAAREAAAEEAACRAKAAKAEMETLRSELAAQERKATAASAPATKFDYDMDSLRSVLRGSVLRGANVANVQIALQSRNLTPLSRPYRQIGDGRKFGFDDRRVDTAGCSILDYARAKGLACVAVLEAWEY